MVRIYNGVPVGSDANSDVVQAIEDMNAQLSGKLDGLSALVGEMLANAYEILDLDLGTARTASLVTGSVVGFTILDITAGATASIALFSPSNPPIVVPDDLNIGDGVNFLAGANLYLSNAAQTGSSLKLFVLKRV